MLLEVTAPQRWVDVTFGLTDGWWQFTDHDLRADYPLLSPAQWRALLAELGLDEVATVPATTATEGGARGEHGDPGLGAARVSGSPWLVLADRAGVGEALAAALGGAASRSCSPAPARPAPARRSPRSVRPAAREDVARLVAEGAGGDGRWRGVVHCWASTRRRTGAAPT